MELIRIISEMINQREHTIIAIDGRCASGKTTLADRLSKFFCCNCVHIDDFFLQPHQRTPDRFSLPGENIDHERFRDEVLLPLKCGLPFSYRRYDCRTQSLGSPVHIDPGRLTIIEGVYSCHPELRSFYDLTIFMRISPELQRERIIKRSPDLAERFFSTWIPLEEAYFTAFDIENSADQII